jgi:prolycopene isomerase
MSTPEFPQQCDVVVIGSGMGGLTSAALLAKAGLSVCVLEMDRRPGGYLAGFERGGFVFDTAIHWLNQCGQGGHVRTVLDYIGPGAPATPPLRTIRRYKGESFDYVLTSDPDELRDDLMRDFPVDARAIRSFFAAAKRIGRSFEGLASCMRTRETMTLAQRARMGMKLSRLGFPFLRYISRPADRVMAKYFKSAGLRKVFCTEEDILSVLVPIGWAYSGDYQIPPAGGSQAFPAWLTERISEQGSSVHYRCRVDRVLVDGERAVGVRFTHARDKDPHEIACRYVVAACDLEMLYEKALPPGLIPPKLLGRLRTAALYQSSVTISLGLDTHPRNLGFGEEMLIMTRDGVERSQHNNGDPDTACITILAPSLRDPTLAPEGKGTLTLYVAAEIHYADDWKTEAGYKRGKAYRAFKRDYADILLQRVEDFIAPGLREHIEVCEVATPITHWRYTGNRDGTIMAARPTRDNFRNKVAHYRTPVKNLLLGGHWAEYGGGVPIAVKAGSNSAAIILQQERPEEFQQLSQVLDGYRAPDAFRELAVTSGARGLASTSSVAATAVPAQRQHD